MLIAGIGLYLAAHYALKYANGMVAEYTDTSPMTLPKSDLPPDDLKQLKTRVAAFDAAMDAHTNVPPLVLTGPEINALISDTAQTKEFKDRFFVALDGDEIKGQLSLPLDGIPQLQIFNVKGRYLNGSGTFKASITNGLLYVMVQSLEVKGKPLPAKFLAGLQQQNLAQSFNDRTNGTGVRELRECAGEGRHIDREAEGELGLFGRRGRCVDLPARFAGGIWSGR